MMETSIPSVLFLASVLCASVSSHVLRDVSVNDSYSVFQSSILFPPLPITVVGSTNEQCRKDSQALLENLRNSTTWAMQMLDASAKGAEGVLTGNYYQFGNFDECIETVYPIQAKYCIVSLTIEPPDNIRPSNNAGVFYNPLGSVWNKIWHIGDHERIPRNTIKRALCVPASCSHTDVQASVRRHLDASPSNLTISVAVHPSLCQTNRAEETLSGGSILYCIVMASMVIVTLVSTFCDNNKYSLETEKQSKQLKHKNTDDCVSIFSVKRNLYGLWKPSSFDFGCINGMKVISTGLIIFVHRVFLACAGPVDNYERMEKGRVKFLYSFLMQADVVVDTFYVISGLLLTYGLFRTLDRSSVNPIKVILFKYIRFTPVYAVIVFFYATVMYHCGSGPLWTAIIGREREFCQENWWTNLLYVNNYVNDGRLCMLHSWFMSPEFHLCIVSVLLVLLINKYPTLGYTTLGLAIVASLVAPFIISLSLNLQPLHIFNDALFKLPRTDAFFQHMYTKTHVHATPYLVGVIAGLMFYRKQLQKVKYSWQSTLGLVMGCLLCVGTLLPGCFMISHNWKYNDVVAAMEQPQRRLFWPMGVAMILFSLAFSKDSVINKFLSCRAMAVLSRLCYSAYLTSLCLQLLQVGSAKSISTLSFTTGLIGLFTDIGLTLMVSVTLYLIFEAPFANLITHIMRRRERREPHSVKA